MEFEKDSSESTSSTELSRSAGSAPSTSSPTSSSHAPAAAATTHKRKAGRKKFRETRHPVYRGVRERNGGKWVCEVREPRKKTRIWLGTYPTPEMAARAHDVAVIALRGSSAPLNFAESAWALPRAESTSHEDIRRAASETAEMYRPSCTATRAEAEVEAVFEDEEAMFNMPGLLDSMAEGMLLTPPGMREGLDWDNINGTEFHMDLSLWSTD